MSTWRNLLDGLSSDPEHAGRTENNRILFGFIIGFIFIVILTFATFVNMQNNHSLPANQQHSSTMQDVSAEDISTQINNAQHLTVTPHGNTVDISISDHVVAHTVHFEDTEGVGTPIPRRGISTQYGEMIVNAGTITGAATVTDVLWGDNNTMYPTPGEYDPNTVFGYLRDTGHKVFIEGENAQDEGYVRNAPPEELKSIYNTNGTQAWNIISDDNGTLSLSKNMDASVTGMQAIVMITYLMDTH